MDYHIGLCVSENTLNILLVREIAVEFAGHVDVGVGTAAGTEFFDNDSAEEPRPAGDENALLGEIGGHLLWTPAGHRTSFPAKQRWK
jgi:hypothetical protein